jgi:hypothetical protein
LLLVVARPVYHEACARKSSVARHAAAAREDEGREDEDREDEGGQSKSEEQMPRVKARRAISRRALSALIKGGALLAAPAFVQGQSPLTVRFVQQRGLLLYLGRCHGQRHPAAGSNQAGFR